METKLVKFEPESTKPEELRDGTLSGFVMLKKPSVAELFEGTRIAKGAEGQEIEMAQAIMTWAGKFVAEVKVKNQDGTRYESYDDLMSDGECLEFLQEIAAALLQGVSKKKRSALKMISSGS